MGRCDLTDDRRDRLQFMDFKMNGNFVHHYFYAEAKNLMGEVSKILKNHAPVHLRKTAGQMGYFRLLGDAISGPLGILYDDKYLLPAESGAMPAPLSVT